VLYLSWIELWPQHHHVKQESCFLPEMLKNKQILPLRLQRPKINSGNKSPQHKGILNSLTPTPDSTYTDSLPIVPCQRHTDYMQIADILSFEISIVTQAFSSAPVRLIC
jgi:hypothetical protein